MPDLPTGLVNASSANVNVNMLNIMAINIGASSTYTATSANTLYTICFNFINSSAGGSSALVVANLALNAVASSTNINSSSGALYRDQLFQASSALNSLLLQVQSGLKISS